VIIVRERSREPALVATRRRPWPRVQTVRTSNVEVVQSTAREGGEIVEYRVQLKLGFEYEE